MKKPFDNQKNRTPDVLLRTIRQNSFRTKQIFETAKRKRTKENMPVISKNEQLELQNNEQNIHYVESFMRVYEKTIVEQAKDMEKLLTEIKEVMCSKEYLHGKKDHYEKLLRSERFTDLIQKIRRIKEIKVEMYDFLKTKGIIQFIDRIIFELIDQIETLIIKKKKKFKDFFLKQPISKFKIKKINVTPNV